MIMQFAKGLFDNRPTDNGTRGGAFYTLAAEKEQVNKINSSLNDGRYGLN